MDRDNLPVRHIVQDRDATEQVPREHSRLDWDENRTDEAIVDVILLHRSTGVPSHRRFTFANLAIAKKSPASQNIPQIALLPKRIVAVDPKYRVAFVVIVEPNATPENSWS